MQNVDVITYQPQGLADSFSNKAAGMTTVHYVASKVPSGYSVHIGQMLEVWSVDKIDSPTLIVPSKQAQVIGYEEDEYGGIYLDLVLAHVLDEEPYRAQEQSIYRHLSRGHMVFQTSPSDVRATMPPNTHAGRDQEEALIAWLQKNPAFYDTLKSGILPEHSVLEFAENSNSNPEVYLTTSGEPLLLQGSIRPDNLRIKSI